MDFGNDFDQLIDDYCGYSSCFADDEDDGFDISGLGGDDEDDDVFSIFEGDDY